MQSAEFIRLTFFFLINSFWMNFYIGSFDVQLGDSRALSISEQHNYARFFTIIITCGVIAIPFVGMLMDGVGFPFTSVFTIFMGCSWAGLLLIDSKFSLIISFVCYSIYRTFFFTFLFAYLADVLGFKYFGALAGIMFVLGGLLSLLQYPLVQYSSGTCHLMDDIGLLNCTEGNWFPVNVVMLLTLGSTLYFSYKDWVRRKQLESLKPSPSYSGGVVNEWTPLNKTYAHA